MVLAGPGTAAVDTVEGDEHHPAVAVRLHGIAQVPVGHGEDLPENVVWTVLLQQGVFPLAVHAVEVGPARGEHAEIFQAGGVDQDGLPLLEAALLRFEAGEHGLQTLPADALKKLYLIHSRRPPCL